MLAAELAAEAGSEAVEVGSEAVEVGSEAAEVGSESASGDLESPGRVILAWRLFVPFDPFAAVLARFGVGAGSGPESAIGSPAGTAAASTDAASEASAVASSKGGVASFPSDSEPLGAVAGSVVAAGTCGSAAVMGVADRAAEASPCVVTGKACPINASQTTGSAPSESAETQA